MVGPVPRLADGLGGTVDPGLPRRHAPVQDRSGPNAQRGPGRREPVAAAALPAPEPGGRRDARGRPEQDGVPDEVRSGLRTCFPAQSWTVKLAEQAVADVTMNVKPPS